MKKWLREHRIDLLVWAISLVVAIPLGIMGKDLAIFVAVMAWPAAFSIAKYYGDVAAGEATRKHAEEQSRQARLLAGKALLVEVYRIGMLAELNAASRGHVKLPVSAIETAFISKEPVFEFRAHIIEGTSQFDDSLILDSAGLWNAVEEYLTLASAINALVDERLAAIAGGIAYENFGLDIAQRCATLPLFLDRLREYLMKEMQRLEGS